MEATLETGGGIGDGEQNLVSWRCYWKHGGL